MGVHGTTGATSATTPQLPARPQTVPVACCDAVREGSELRQQRQSQKSLAARPTVAGADAAAPRQLATARLPQAMQQTACPHDGAARPSVRGGGASALARPTPATGVNPAFAALTAMLADSAPPAAPASLLVQLSNQLTVLLALIGARIGSLMPGAGSDVSAAAGRADAGPARGDAPAAPMLMQPPPPPGPLLTLDPALGTIVDLSRRPGTSDDPSSQLPGTDHDGEPGSKDQPRFTLPSAWVPIVGMLRPRAVGGGIKLLVARLDDLLTETGITRLQLLILTLLAPVVIAFLIDVVVSILSQR